MNYKLNSQIDGVRCRLLNALDFYVPMYYEFDTCMFVALILIDSKNII